MKNEVSTTTCESERQRASLLTSTRTTKREGTRGPPVTHMFLSQHSRPRGPPVSQNAFGRGKEVVPASHFIPSSASGQAKFSTLLEDIFAPPGEDNICKESQKCISSKARPGTSSPRRNCPRDGCVCVGVGEWGWHWHFAHLFASWMVCGVVLSAK